MSEYTTTIDIKKEVYEEVIQEKVNKTPLWLNAVRGILFLILILFMTISIVFYFEGKSSKSRNENNFIATGTVFEQLLVYLNLIEGTINGNYPHINFNDEDFINEVFNDLQSRSGVISIISP